jgi:hypothetical protein
VGKLFDLMVTDSRALTAALLAAFAVAIVVGFLISRLRRRHMLARERASSVPLVVFAPRAGSVTPSAGESMPARPFSPFVPGEDSSPEHSWPTPAYVGYAENGHTEAAGGNGAPSPYAGRTDLLEGHTVRFYRPPEGTLQMLPGRLEIVEGEDRGHSIRFVKMRPGAQQITFGRKEGSPYEHIQLRSLTVSRQHARLDFEHGRWSVINLSETNPVVVNGESLEPGSPTRPLADGDRIEMGEVVFLFKER